MYLPRCALARLSAFVSLEMRRLRRHHGADVRGAAGVLTGSAETGPAHFANSGNCFGICAGSAGSALLVFVTGAPCSGIRDGGASTGPPRANLNVARILFFNRNRLWARSSRALPVRPRRGTATSTESGPDHAS